MKTFIYKIKNADMAAKDILTKTLGKKQRDNKTNLGDMKKKWAWPAWKQTGEQNWHWELRHWKDTDKKSAQNSTI